jgi:hypothetical protein
MRVGAKAQRLVETFGDTIELREAPKAHSYQAAAETHAVARVMTSGTVRTLEMQQWTTRSEAPQHVKVGENVQRLSDCGVLRDLKIESDLRESAPPEERP